MDAGTAELLADLAQPPPRAPEVTARIARRLHRRSPTPWMLSSLVPYAASWFSFPVPGVHTVLLLGYVGMNVVPWRKGVREARRFARDGVVVTGTIESFQDSFLRLRFTVDGIPMAGRGALRG